jgi:hypothetical protein
MAEPEGDAMTVMDIVDEIVKFPYKEPVSKYICTYI